MKPVFQNTDTNCLQACIATLLDLKLGEVPDFCKIPGDDEWWDALQAWLGERNLFFLMVGLHEKTPWYSTPSPWAIFVGFSEIGILHAVVGRVNGGEFEVVHNPGKTPRGIDEIDAICFLCPLDPLVAPVIPREKRRIISSTILPANGVRFPKQ